jgi:hypothetical protein
LIKIENPLYLREEFAFGISIIKVKGKKFSPLLFLPQVGGRVVNV